MHPCVLYAPWRIERESSAGPGTPGPSCSGCWPATPRSRSCTSRPTANAGAAVGELYPGPARRPTSACRVRAARRRRPRRPRPRVLRAAARREPGVAARPARPRRPRRSTSAPTSGSRPTCTRAGTARRTARPRSSDRFAYGLVELYRDEIATHAHVASPGCYPTAVSLACAPLARARARRAAHHRRRGVGRLGRGPRPQDHEPVLGGERERLARTACSRTATPRRWSRRSRRSRGNRCRCCSRRTSCRRRAASSPRVTRARRRPGLSTARLLEHYREFYADDPCVVVVDEPSGTKATYGANVAHVTVRFDARTETVVAIAAEDNLVKGASGQMIQAANLLLGLPETTGLPLARDPAVSITAAEGFVAGGLACGIKESGAPDLALVATDDRARRCPRRRCSRRNLAQAAPVQVSRAHLADGRAAAVVLSSGNANAATGEPGRRDARRMCELAARRASSVATADVLVCSTGLIGIPMPMAALEAGIPKLCGVLARRRRRRRGAGDAHHRHRAQGGDRAAPGDAIVGGMAKGAAMLSPAMATMLAVLTTDAAVDPHVLQQRAGARGARDLRLPQRRRLPLHERHRDRARQRARRRGRRARSSPTRSPRCAARSPSRWRATPKARPSSCGSGSSARARRPRRAIAARAVANSQLVQCSLNGGDPYWGRVLSELGASGAFIDPEAVDIAYNGVTVCRDGVACAHDEAALAARMAGARDRDPRATCTSRTARRRCSPPTSRTRTSTRTGARRDRRCTDVDERGADAGEKATSSPRRCRTSASSRARPS